MNTAARSASREVTGACYLVRSPDPRFLTDSDRLRCVRDAPARNRKPKTI